MNLSFFLMVKVRKSEKEDICARRESRSYRWVDQFTLIFVENAVRDCANLCDKHERKQRASAVETAKLWQLHFAKEGLHGL